MLQCGETLHVSLHDGSERVAPFVGYGELALLLKNPAGGQPLRVPFEFAKEIRRASGEMVELKALTRAFRDRALPSAEALALEEANPVGSLEDRLANALRVSVEDIQSVIADVPASSGVRGAQIAGIVVLSVIVSVVLVFWIISSSIESSSKSCGATPISFGAVHLTTRPFDRYRGCFVGDPLAVADSWPASMEIQLAKTSVDSPQPATYR